MLSEDFTSAVVFENVTDAVVVGDVPRDSQWQFEFTEGFFKKNPRISFGKTRVTVFQTFLTAQFRKLALQF